MARQWPENHSTSFKTRFSAKSPGANGLTRNLVGIAAILVIVVTVKEYAWKSAKKSCNLHPLPASLMKNCLDMLLPTITNIVNLSLSTGTMPETHLSLNICLVFLNPELLPMAIKHFLYALLSYGMNCLYSCACRQIYKHLNQDWRQCFLKWPIIRWAFALLFCTLLCIFFCFLFFCSV